MSEEKKYEILPGVELPDIKSIKEAASDFSVSGVSDIKINNVKAPVVSEASGDSGVSAEELAALQSLGDKVAADEARAAAESRRRMDQIMSTAVKAPESIVDLLNYNRDKVSEERIREKEEELRKAEELKQAALEKERQREERRQLQQRLLMEARERAASMREAERRGIKADESLLRAKEDISGDEEPLEAAILEPAENVEPVETAETVEPAIADEPVQTETEPVEETATIKAPEVKPVETKKPEEEVKPSIASAEETFDDFSEFLDDGK